MSHHRTFPGVNTGHGPNRSLNGSSTHPAPTFVPVNRQHSAPRASLIKLNGSDTQPKPALVPANSQHSAVSRPAMSAGYLSYAPAAAGLRNGRRNYTLLLDALGFNPDVTLREEFVKNVSAYLDSSEYRYLRKKDNEEAFTTLVKEFMTEHGDTYWGRAKRDHLEEPDISKGFLYPRDAHRDNSRLVHVLEILFDYRAINLHRNDAIKKEDKRVVHRIDFGHMTGLKADAMGLDDLKAGRSWKSSPELIANEGRLSGPSRRKRKKTHVATSDSEESYQPYNSLDVVETETRLRPKPAVWSREPSGGLIHEQINAKSLSTPLSMPEFGRSSEELSAIAPGMNPRQTTKITKRKRATRHAVTPERFRQSSSDSDTPLAAKFTKPLTPATTRGPSIAVSQNDKAPVISLDSSPERDFFSRPRARNPQHKEAKLEQSLGMIPVNNVKLEPLSADAVAKTIFRVSASNIPEKGPVRVPFASCPSSNSLFSTLIEERKIRGELSSKISDITATCTWSGKRYGIRKGKPEDWADFCTYLRKSWDKAGNAFEDGCEIDMMIHVDD